jgi:CheY-like chemotaxis protein
VTRILYVEDNDDNVYMLKLRFELLDDFEILIAENGEMGAQSRLRSNLISSSWILMCPWWMDGRRHAG